MEHINVNKLDDYTVSGTASISASIKPDKDSTEQKTVTLRFKLDNMPVSSILSSSLTQKRINWANSNRKRFNAIADGSIVELDYTAPSKMYVDPEIAYQQQLANKSAEEQKASILATLEKLGIDVSELEDVEDSE